jgi:predicted nucleic acid-binding protein
MPLACTQAGNVTAYDAMSVALAEALDAPIGACDTPLARAAGHRARIEVIE